MRLTLAPDLLRKIAKYNPFTYAVDASRALVAGHLDDTSVLCAFIIAVLAVLGMIWATRSLRQAVMWLSARNPVDIGAVYCVY